MPKAIVDVARRDFDQSLSTAMKIYGNVREGCNYNWESINEGPGPTICQKIVGLAFVGVIAGWEDFLENSFLRYMTGAKTLSGYGPELLVGPCKSISHARRILGGSHDEKQAAKRLFWSDPKWVATTAKLFFKDYQRYELNDGLSKLRIESAYAIRNRVVHNSDRAKLSFKRTANHLMKVNPDSPLPRGFSPGRLLTYQGETATFSAEWIEYNYSEYGDLFDSYVSWFDGISGCIVPI